MFAFASVALLTLAACSSTTDRSPVASNPQSQPAACTPGPGCDQVWVSVFGPRDGNWVPVNDYVLEIGHLAFRLTPDGPTGVTSITTLVPVRVRVVRLIDCATLIVFDAQPGTGHTPGSGWRIRFDARDHLTLESVQHGDVTLMGPALAEGTPSGCP